MKIKVNVFVKILAAILDIFSFVCTDRNDESERNRPKMYTALSEKSCINNKKKIRFRTALLLFSSNCATVLDIKLYDLRIQMYIAGF